MKLTLAGLGLKVADTWYNTLNKSYWVIKAEDDVSVTLEKFKNGVAQCNTWRWKEALYILGDSPHFKPFWSKLGMKLNTTYVIGDLTFLVTHIDTSPPRVHVLSRGDTDILSWVDFLYQYFLDMEEYVEKPIFSLAMFGLQANFDYIGPNGSRYRLLNEDDTGCELILNDRNQGHILWSHVMSLIGDLPDFKHPVIQLGSRWRKKKLSTGDVWTVTDSKSGGILLWGRYGEETRSWFSFLSDFEQVPDVTSEEHPNKKNSVTYTLDQFGLKVGDVRIVRRGEVNMIKQEDAKGITFENRTLTGTMSYITGWDTVLAELKQFPHFALDLAKLSLFLHMSYSIRGKSLVLTALTEDGVELIHDGTKKSPSWTVFLYHYAPYITLEESTLPPSDWDLLAKRGFAKETLYLDGNGTPFEIVGANKDWAAVRLLDDKIVYWRLSHSALAKPELAPKIG